MTDLELNLLKQTCRAEAAEVLLKAFCGSLGKLGLDVQRHLLDAQSRMRQEYSCMTFPGLPAEYSDLYAAEFQEAIEQLPRRLMRIVAEES